MEAKQADKGPKTTPKMFKRDMSFKIKAGGSRRNVFDAIKTSMDKA